MSLRDSWCRKFVPLMDYMSRQRKKNRTLILLLLKMFLLRSQYKMPLQPQNIFQQDIEYSLLLEIFQFLHYMFLLSIVCMPWLLCWYSTFPLDKVSKFHPRKDYRSPPNMVCRRKRTLNSQEMRTPYCNPYRQPRLIPTIFQRRTADKC